MEEFVECVLRRIRKLESAHDRVCVNAENETDQIRNAYFNRLAVKIGHKIEALYELLDDITY